MEPEDAVAFVATNGLVLEAARGPVPNLVEEIAGEPVHGSWWAHPLSHTIFAAIQSVRDDSDVLVCRLVNGKVTYVHRRLWPALSRLAPELGERHTAVIREVHTQTGAHHVEEMSFAESISLAAMEASQQLTREEAIDQLGKWILQLLTVEEC